MQPQHQTTPQTYTVARVHPSGLAEVIYTTERRTSAERTRDRLNAVRPTDDYCYEIQVSN